MEIDRADGDELRGPFAKRPMTNGPQGREARGVVGRKNGNPGEARLALLRRPPALGDGGPLCPDARCLPERRDRRAIEGPMKQRHLVELPLKPFPENQLRLAPGRLAGEHRLRIAIEMHMDRIAAADNSHLVPIVGTQTHVGPLRAQGEAKGVVGILPGDEWLRGEAGAERPLPVACATALTEPHPGNEGCILRRRLSREHEFAAGQMHGPVDRIGARERRRHEGLASAAACPGTDAGEIPGEAGAERRRSPVSEGIPRFGAIFIVEPPEADGLGGEHGLRGGAVVIGGRASRLPRHLLERRHERIDDLRFSRDLEAGSPRGPGGVAAEDVLLGGRDVALGAVGKLHIEMHARGGTVAELESGEGINLVGERRNRDVADADRLELDRRPLPLMEDQRLAGVDLRDVLGEIFGDSGGDAAGPREPGLVGQSIAEVKNLLRDGKGDIVAVVKRLDHPHRLAGHGGGIVLDGCRTLLNAVIHPHQITAGALRERADERAVAIPRRSEGRRDELAEQAEVIRRHRGRPEVVLRIIRKQGERLSGRILDRDHRELRIDRPRRADDLLGEMPRVHVGKPRRIAEGIDNARLRPAHPAPVVGVVPVIDFPPADSGRGEALVGRHDRRRNRRRQPGRVRRIDAGSQTRKSRRGGVRMGRRDHDPLDRDAGPRRCKRLRLVDERLRHHAGIDDDQRQAHRRPPLGAAVLQDDRPDEERIVDTIGPPFEKPSGDDRRGFRRGVARRDVRCRCSGPEVPRFGGGRAGNGKHQARSEHGRKGQGGGERMARHHLAAPGGHWGLVWPAPVEPL